MPTLSRPSTTSTVSDSLEDRQILRMSPTTPNTQRLPAITRARFSLFRFRSPLLSESRLLSLPVGTEMFHFPTFPPLALCVQARVTGHDSSRVSPFGNPRITARLAAPRGLSQPPTSFFGSWCQGIHRAPLLTWPQRCSRPLCSSQETGGSPSPPRGRTRRMPAIPSKGGAHRTARLREREGSRSEEAASAVPSGPNSVPRRRTASPFPLRRSGCTRDRSDPAPNGQCSTLELHPRGECSWRGPGRDLRRARARCSLERR